MNEDIYEEEDTQEPTLKIPEWNPAQQAFAGEVVEYIPGYRLVYQRRNGQHEPLFVITLCTFFGLIFGAFASEPFQGLSWALALGGIYLLGRWKTGAYLPTIWDFQLHKQRLFWRRGEDEIEYPLDEVQTIKLTHTRNTRALPNPHSFGNYDGYNAEISLIGLPEDDDLLVAETGEEREDPEGTYYDGLAFANMLAVALHIPLDIQIQE